MILSTDAYGDANIMIPHLQGHIYYYQDRDGLLKQLLFKTIYLFAAKSRYNTPSCQ
jgi:hypothetical protein